MNHLQRGWFDTQQIACRGTEFKMMGKRLISDAQESVGGVKLLNLEKKAAFLRVAARREGRVAGDAVMRRE